MTLIAASTLKGDPNWASIAKSAAAGAPYLERLITKWPSIILALAQTAPDNIFGMKS